MDGGREGSDGGGGVERDSGERSKENTGREVRVEEAEERRERRRKEKTGRNDNDGGNLRKEEEREK